MTKQEILDKFNDIDFFYNDSSKHETLSRMLDELLKEQEPKDAKEIVHPEPSCELKYITVCCCDLCGVQLIREDNFCRGCGKPIEWSK